MVSDPDRNVTSIKSPETSHVSAAQQHCGMMLNWVLPWTYLLSLNNGEACSPLYVEVSLPTLKGYRNPLTLEGGFRVAVAYRNDLRLVTWLVCTQHCVRRPPLPQTRR